MDIDTILKSAEKLAKIMKVKIDSIKKDKLDSEVIAKFLKSVLSIIKMHIPGEASKRILTDIISQVIVPMMSRDEINSTDIKTFKEIE